MSVPSKRTVPALRRDLAGDQADQRGLAGSVGADHGVDFARQNIERDRVGRHNAAEAPGQTAYLQQRFSHGAGLRADPQCRRADRLRPKAKSVRGSGRDISVSRDSPSSSSRNVTAPISGPNSEPRPPRHHHDDEVARAGPVHQRRTDEVGVVGKERSGEPAQRTGDHEADELIAKRRKADRAHAPVRWNAQPRITRPKRELTMRATR